jgi:small subunit ribosomal protein S8
MDPIANMVIMMKNASRAGHESVTFPYSKIKFAIASCLEKAGYVKNVSKKAKKNFQVIEVGLLYKDEASRIHDIERVSKVSRRTYMGVSELKPVKNGIGSYVLSTPKGVLTDKEAKKEHVGGEVILSIW